MSGKKRKEPEIRDDKEIIYEDHGQDFGKYIQNKRRKLVNQFNKTYNSYKSNLFKNMVLFVNGHTVPPQSILMEMIIENGGHVDMTLTSKTTHMICDNLPITKLKQIRTVKSNLIVCQPNWVLDCINANKLIPHGHIKYKVTGTTNYHDNNKLNFKAKNKTNNETNDEINNENKNIDFNKIFGNMSTLTNPNFVEHFFKTSRLRYIIMEYSGNYWCLIIIYYNI